MKALTRLAVENRTLLDHLETHGAPKSVEEFARILERDPSNFRKTLKALAAEGWLLLGKAAGGTPVQLTDDGHQAAKGLQVAEGRLRAGLPPLIHAQITPDPNQPRQQFDAEDLGELAENIADRGLLQPVLVRLTGPDRADLVAGERRWRAIGLLIDKADPRWPADRPIPYHVSAQSDEAEILADQVVENLQRKGLHPLEEALAFHQLKEAHGWGVGQISKAVTRTRRFVEQRLDLMNLTPDLQARMRLPKDDPQFLTIPRAREILQHLRQINEKTAEQRDLEEIAPGGAHASPEDLEAARKPKLEPRDLLALGEIAAAAELNPSPDFPDSPVPVVEIDWTKAMASQSVIRLETNKLAQLLINGQIEPKVAGARLQPLGHIRLRQENLHPADNPRALFHLRREAGISADQARQLGNLGRWATPFLTITPPAAAAPAPVPVEAPAEVADEPTPGRAKWFSTAVREAAVAEARAQPGGERDVSAKLSGATTSEGEAWPEEASEIIATPWPDRPVATIRLYESSHARWGICLSTQGRTAGQGDAFGVWTNDPIFSSRADALAHAADRIAHQLGEEARPRKVRDWLAALPSPIEPQDQVTEPAPATDPVAALTDVEIRILREVAHAQASVGGGPARVGRYWLDLDAVNLWKRAPAGLLEFKAQPGEAWTVELTEQGQAVVKALEPDYDPVALQMRIEREGKFQSDWLNPVDLEAEPSEPTAEAEISEVLAETPDDSIEEEGAKAVLAKVRATLDRGHTAAEIRELLDQVGLQRPFEAAGRNIECWEGEAGIVFDGRGVEAAVADTNGMSPHAIAQARGELLAYALNVATTDNVGPALRGPIDGHPVERLVEAAEAIRKLLLREIDPASGVFAAVERVYSTFDQAVRDTRGAIASAARDVPETSASLLEIRTGDIVTKGGAMTWRLLEPFTKPGHRAHAFKAQPILHGKDYGKPTTISLADITALVEEAR
jgi:ParB/RepB/Spo0J family partition protein